jgi:hypothetical protein
MYTPYGLPIPAAAVTPLAASVTLAKGGYVMLAPATGYGSPGANATPNQIPAGVLNPIEGIVSSSVAAGSTAQVDTCPFWGVAASTVSNDGFTAADVCTPFWIAGANTPGKLSNNSGKRSLGGLVLGIDTLGTSTPIQWSSPIAWALARSVLVNDAEVFAADSFALTANTTRAEASIPRNNAAPGRVVKVRVLADAGFTAHDANYWTITVARRTAAAPGTAVTVATATFKITGGTGNLTAWKYADLTLSATSANLDFLETDTFTVVCTSETTAAGIARFTVEVVGKVG